MPILMATSHLGEGTRRKKDDPVIGDAYNRTNRPKAIRIKFRMTLINAIEIETQSFRPRYFQRDIYTLAGNICKQYRLVTTTRSRHRIHLIRSENTIDRPSKSI